MGTSECEVCGGARWVCEDHPDKPWDGASDREDACHCGGAGMPCLVRNRTIGQEPPEMPPGYRTMIDTDGPKHLIIAEGHEDMDRPARSFRPAVFHRRRWTPMARAESGQSIE